MAGSACPKCGHVQERRAECARCGVIFNKVRSSSRPTPMAPGHTHEVPQQRGWGIPVVVILGLCTTVAILFSQRRAPASLQSARPSPAAEAPIAAATDLPAAASVAPFAPAESAATPQPAMEAPPTAVATPQNSPSSAPTPEPSAAPDAFVETFEWYQDADGYRRAREDSTASGRPMVVYVYTDWCPYCREFEREILDTLVVKTYLRAFPKVKVNPEANRASEQVKDALGVDGFPTFLVLNPATRGIARVSRMAGDRLKTPQEFVDACQRMAGSGS